MTTTDIIQTQLGHIRPGETDLVLGMTVTRIGLDIWRVNGVLCAPYNDYAMAALLSEQARSAS